MLRFRKLIPGSTLLKLYKAYILPHFYYCSSVWHFCGARDAEKLEALNKRILSFILGDYSSPYSSLITKVNSTSLANKRIQNFLTLLYKSLFFPHFPAYMKNMFSLRSSPYDLRGNYILSLSKPRTTCYGLNSIHFPISQPSNGMRCQTISGQVTLQSSRGTFRALPSFRRCLLNTFFPLYIK